MTSDHFNHHQGFFVYFCQIQRSDTRVTTHLFNFCRRFFAFLSDVGQGIYCSIIFLFYCSMHACMHAAVFDCAASLSCLDVSVCWSVCSARPPLTPPPLLSIFCRSVCLYLPLQALSARPTKGVVSFIRFELHNFALNHPIFISKRVRVSLR